MVDAVEDIPHGPLDPQHHFIALPQYLGPLHVDIKDSVEAERVVLALKSEEVIGVAGRHHAPEIMCQYLLESLLLLSLEQRMAEKLFAELVFTCYFEDELRVDQNGPQQQSLGRLGVKSGHIGQLNSNFPIFLIEAHQRVHVVLFHHQ